MTRSLSVALLFVAGCSGGGNTAGPTIAADKLLAEYRADEKAADAKYKGKRVTVTGNVVEIWLNFPRGSKQSVAAFEKVICNFAADEYDGATSLAVDHPATITGVCRGMENKRVSLLDCHVIRR